MAGAANQINTLLQKHNLNTVFLATDATSKGNFWTSYCIPSLCISKQLKLISSDIASVSSIHCYKFVVLDKKEITKLVKGHVVWFSPSDSVLDRYGDGGVAIIDQWVAAHGKVFVGTSYRRLVVGRCHVRKSWNVCEPWWRNNLTQWKHYCSIVIILEVKCCTNHQLFFVVFCGFLFALWATVHLESPQVKLIIWSSNSI